MTKEQLIKMGLTEEQATAVMAELDGNFIPKTRFNEVNTELKQAKDTVKERDTQLETLKAEKGDAAALTAKITELQTANTTQAETHAAEIKQLKFDTALTAALSGAKARNPETVKPLLKAFLEKAELDEAGTIKGLDAEIKKLTETNETKFLFDAESKPKENTTFKGLSPNDGKDKQQTDTPKTLADAVKAHYEAQGTNT
jgi:hypothetical protein